MPIIGSLFGSDAGKASKKAAEKNQILLNDLNQQNIATIDAAGTASKGHLNQGIAGLEPFATTGKGANTMFGNALGLNGEEGNQAAIDAFQAGPGYQFQLDQGLQALERKASSLGQHQSGQTGLDFIRYSQGLADQEFDQWLDNLFRGSQSGQAAANSQAGQYGNLASLEQSIGGQKIGQANNFSSGSMAVNNQIASAKEANDAATSFTDGDLGTLVKLAGYGFGL